MRALLALATLAVLSPSVAAQSAPACSPGPGYRADVYAVATAHLDTQWRWTVRDTIDDFLPATLNDNFALFEKYPDYVFSFEGAFRYQLAREYYPAEFERLKGYVRAGRWKVAGSWVDAVDTNVPSPESLIRQALYGNGFFRRELGVTSRDVYLPDCFGFGYALPSVAAHTGLLAFGTQKLTWGSSVKIPFDVGLWQGVDGSSLVATLNPGDYAADLRSNLTLDPDIYAAADRQEALSGLRTTVKLFGTGDVGAAPRERSVRLLQESLAGPGPACVRSVAPDQLARDLVAAGGDALERLPRYRGEFLMTAHGTGCYTSQAAMKRFNRVNQRLAAAAEPASVAAAWLGGLAYPREALRTAWTRFLWHQFHDDLTGTSTPEAYVLSWNDEAISASAFADTLATAVGSVARGLDTRAEGAAQSVVVFNPLALAREDVVEVAVRLGGRAPQAVRVTGPDGREVPAQVLSVAGDETMVAFVARVEPLSFSTFTVAAGRGAAGRETKTLPRGLENGRYKVALDAQGDIASVWDKRLGRELLSGPARLQLIADEPQRWPAWEIEYSAVSNPPREVVAGPATIRVVEDGPARVALEVVRKAAGSTFTQRIRLAAGAAGDRVEILTDVDWRTPATLLKAAFPLAAENVMATYDLGLGVAVRGVNRPNLYEVPAQYWADVTDAGGAFGVAVLNDGRHGWDRPDGRTLRLTLAHTPRIAPNSWWKVFDEQASNDLGRHRVLVALAGHAGDWRAGRVPQAGDRLEHPLRAWPVPAHSGALGRSFSLARVEGGDGGEAPVAVRAVKQAEESDEIVVRLQELRGEAAEGVRLRFAVPVVAVRELNGAEEAIAEHGTGGALSTPPPPLALAEGVVTLDFVPFRPRTLAVKLGPPPVQLAAAEAAPLELPFDRDGVSRDEARKDGDFDGAGRTLAGELLPAELVSAGVPFRTGPQAPGARNVLDARGQTLTLPAGGYDRLHLLAAAVGGDRRVRFAIDGAPVDVTVPDWAEPVGQWDSRVVAGVVHEDPAAIAPAYAKTTPLGWVGTHRHGARGENEAYALSHVYRLRLDLPAGAKAVTLPNDPNVRLLAATATRGAADAWLAPAPFADPAPASVVHFETPAGPFVGRTSVVLTSPNPGATIRYTLDGSAPTAASTAYSGPIAIERTTTVKARAFAPGLADAFVTAATFTSAPLRDPAPVSAGELAPGLTCRVYEGDFPSLPDFATLTPVATLTMPTLGLPPDRSPDRIGMVCEGFLSVPADGLYTLSLRSAHASQLWVDGEKRIDNDTIDFLSRRGQAALRAGLHAVEVRWHHRQATAGLALKIDGPGEPLTEVAAGRYFHRPR